MTDRTPPQDLDAEQSVLGAMMLSADVVGDVTEALVAADFYRRAHGTIFDTILGLYAKGEPVDLVATMAALKGTDVDPLVLQECAELVPSPASAAHYARIVAEAAAKRRLISAAAGVLDIAYGPTAAPEAIEQAEGLIYAAARRRDSDAAAPVSDLVIDAIDDLHNPNPAKASTGFRDLDDRLRGGLRGGQFVVVAARPGHGKSALVAQIARNVAMGVPPGSVLLFSLEMSHGELAMRLLCSEARVPEEKLRYRPTDRDWEAVTRAAESFSRSRFVIVDSGETTIVDVRARCRRHKAAHGLDLVVLDYLQLMSPTDSTVARERQVAEISRGLKLLAKELDVPVIAVSQLNREREKGKGRDARLSDLRESGSLEQDPDVVAFIDADESERKASVHIAKHRNGPTGSLTLTWIPNLMRFENYAPMGQGQMA